ncbi:MAG TPA: TetR/AcrR family transcriptional regulator [Terricaulis sp.]|nr:TetR/AcrR family transcriptional regulator [Terricaulis sp.]
MSIKNGRKPRIRRAPEAAKEHILLAAEKVLVEQGPLALKLAEVAAAAEVANASVLHHFGSIDGLHAALMQRMTEQLVANILAVALKDADREGKTAAGVEALFDVFETRGAARLAAWMELTGEARQLTNVRKAVQVVVAQRASLGDLNAKQAEDLVLFAVMLAMGAGLFGRSLERLVGREEGDMRAIAGAALRAFVDAHRND